MPLIPSPATGPHGPYNFGFPSALVDIHFPRGGDTSRSLPWYWFITQQTPYYFQYLGSQVGGRGWQCEQFLPIIKILPIDTRPLVPTTQVGFSSVDEAATKADSTPPISSDAFGRFKITGSRFWQVIDKKKPEFTVAKGVPANRSGKDIRTPIKSAIELWTSDWNSLGSTFNAACQGVSGDGSYTVITGSPFAVPLPPVGISLPDLQANSGKYYFGALPSTILFERGSALFWKGAFAFHMGIGQLDPTEWDMSVFPPRNTTAIGAKNIPSSVSGDYGGYSKTFPDFPQNGLNIN